VEDPAGSLPDEVAAMPDMVLFVSMMNYVLIKNAAEKGGGDLWTSTKSSTDVALVNGQYQPTTQLEAGVWNRFRFVFAGINQLVNIVISNSSIANCSLQLLAKDGIYLNKAPRTISRIPMASGNRADIAIACSCPVGSSSCTAELWSVTTPTDPPVSRSQLNDPANPSSGTFNGLLLTLQITGTADPTALRTFIVRRPCYLADLRKAAVPKENIHTIDSVGWTTSGPWQYNWDKQGTPFTYTWPKPSDALASISVGQVHEWTISGSIYHPFHVHVSPYQLIDWSNEVDAHHLLYNTSTRDNVIQHVDEDNYFQSGDWHDTIVMPSTVTLRLQTDNFASPYVLHCHNLAHEDLGMMAFLNVTGKSGQVWRGAELLDPTCYRSAYSENIGSASNACSRVCLRTIHSFSVGLVVGFCLFFL
jgi:FtsP/CotA-like multicopper oxidase with cupredoxin domain